MKEKGGDAMLPKFKTARAHAAYALLRRLYFILLFGYFPSLFLLSVLFDLGSQKGLMQLGFLLPFVVLTIFSFPVLLAILLIGVLIHHLLCVKTGRLGGRLAREGTVCYCLSLLFLILTCVSAITYTESFLPTLSFIGLCVFCLASALLFVCCHAHIRRAAGYEETDNQQESRRLTITKRVLTTAVVAVLALSFLLTPYSTVHYDDGGTVKIQALGYAVVKWNRCWDMANPDRTTEYQNEPQQTRVYLFPDNMKSYDELWRQKH